MNTILLSQEICPEARALMDGRAHVVLPKASGQEAFEEALPLADALILRTNVRLTYTAAEKAKRLQIVCRTGVGVDNVDLDACKEFGILVANTPDANTESVVEHTVSLALALSKQLIRYDHAVREENWMLRSNCISREICGKTIGIVGYGRIGRRVAQVFRDAFGMTVLAYDPFIHSKSNEAGVKIVSNICEIFSAADIVSIHCPSTPQTRGIIDKELLRLAKPGLILVNCARGDIVVERDLIEALRDGSVGGAGLDVFQQEPLVADNPLCGMENVILTPHMAALTKESSIKVAMQAVKQALIKLEGGMPPNLVQ